ncbi:ABC transporter permease [Mesorhizobium sp. CO1-1-8]|uniref:ABC transporter permease n=1 Tax=Mesorhizobium sp. CO1-1-8 TaxID=2876631 RepID=UPI001CD08F2E|nr:ABC transporter permease [Mesorhizobium sp. CO1-1-8]MBZ9772359.1 ABC transporter permease [Mesorhizobium sp. CO1-1-8]
MTDTSIKSPGTGRLGNRPSRLSVDHLTAVALPLTIVGLALVFYWSSPVFLTSANIVDISVQVATLMTISIPFAILLMAGKVDLGVGSLLALSGIVAGLSFPDFGIAGAIIITLLLGTGVGLINGILVGWLSMSPIIVTLGGLTLMRGVAQWLSPNPLFGFPEAFSYMGYGRVLGLPILTWILILVLLTGLAVARFTTIGRHAVAIGVNERASYLVGIRVKLTITLLYAAVGFSSALAGLMTIARINSAPSGTLGVGMELSVLTAVLLGGVPFRGGKGSLVRVALGVWLLGMLSNGLILLNVQTEASLMITGLVLILAAGLDLLRSRRA